MVLNIPDNLPPGRLLATWRQAQVPPLTQWDVGQRVGVSDTLVCQWEAGKRTPDAARAAKIEATTGGFVPAQAWGTLPTADDAPWSTEAASGPEAGERG